MRSGHQVYSALDIEYERPTFNSGHCPTIVFLGNFRWVKKTTPTVSLSTQTTTDTQSEGVNGVNRLATKGEKISLTSDKTRKKLPTSDRKVTEIYRQPTKVEF